MTVTGIVLAGGRSARFGGSKLDAEVAGRRLLEWTMEGVSAVADEVLVVGRLGNRPPARRHGDAGPPSPASRSPRFIPDGEAHGGPLAGLATALAEASTEHVLVVGGDMPLLCAAVLRGLVAALGAPDRPDAALLLEAERARPLPMALVREPARLAAVAALAAGERSLRGFLERLVVQPVPEATWRDLDPEGDSLVDVDTITDLEAVRARLVARA